MPQGLQLVFGADSQNGFSVYKDTGINTVKVYYGMNFYDSSPMDKDSFEYKYLGFSIWEKALWGKSQH